MIHRIALDDCPLVNDIIVLDETKYQPKQEFPIYVTSHDDTSATTDSDFTLSWYQLVVTTSSLESSNTVMFLNNELLFIGIDRKKTTGSLAQWMNCEKKNIKNI